MCTARAVSGAWLPQIYKSREGEGESLTSSLSICCPCLALLLSGRTLPCPRPRSFRSCAATSLAFRLSPAMAPPQPIIVLDPLSWPRSTVMPFALNELVNGGLLAPNMEGAPSAWIVPPVLDREPNPSYGYATNFVQLHERGFNAPASGFMRGLCYRYKVELHNFVPTRFRRWPPLLASTRGS
jgi:hypothetical protein